MHRSHSVRPATVHRQRRSARQTVRLKGRVSSVCTKRHRVNIRVRYLIIHQTILDNEKTVTIKVKTEISVINTELKGEQSEGQ